MDQRIEFALKALRTGNFRALCQEYGISTKTGYKWRERFVRDGIGGLHDQSRRPRSHADELPEGVVCAIVRLKQAHPKWGARKLRELYHRGIGGEVPSESSFKRVLEKAGLTEKRRRRPAIEGGRLTSGLRGEAPNEVWTVDFKGWWRTSRGEKMEPLTIRDEASRMVLDVRLLANTRTESVRACFERLFERHGLPGAIRSDNGSPFASSQGLMGLTRLSAWWLALGISLERGRPGCPQDNGAHERMHRDIRRELQSARSGLDQAAFDLWRHEYNHERPHEGLGMRMPAEVYRDSERRYTGTPEELEYGSMDTRKVQKRTGMIRYHYEQIIISAALAGWSVGLKPSEEKDLQEVWFTNLLVGHLDEKTASFRPAQVGNRNAGKLGAKV